MDLYIIRHAWAVDSGDSRWPADGQRPLSAEGRDRFARMAALLMEHGMKPSLITTSPLTRCVETAQILAAGAGKAEIVELDELQPGSNADALMRWTMQHSRKHEQIAWVGHAPDVNWLTAATIGDAACSIRFAKGAIAAVRFSETPALGGGELQWLATAKILGV